jgi:hypothetical protein
MKPAGIGCPPGMVGIFYFPPYITIELPPMQEIMKNFAKNEILTK